MELCIAICDDEQIITNDLRLRLLEYKPDFKIDVFHSGKNLLENPNKYDIIFLDIYWCLIYGVKKP